MTPFLSVYIVCFLAICTCALPLERRTNACDSLIDLRGATSKNCDSDNAFFWPGSASTDLTQGKKQGKMICDHVVELQLVANVMAATICPPLIADTKLTATQKKALLKPIISSINRQGNLFFLTTPAEEFKGTSFVQITGKQGHADISKTNVPKAVAVEKYLTATKAQSTQVASSIDTEIKSIATKQGYAISPPNVASIWNNFLNTYSQDVANALKKNPLPAPKPSKGAAAPST